MKMVDINVEPLRKIGLLLLAQNAGHEPVTVSAGDDAMNAWKMHNVGPDVEGKGKGEELHDRSKALAGAFGAFTL